MKSKEEIGITTRPTMRSATARLMMNMLDTVWSRLSVLGDKIDQTPEIQIRPIRGQLKLSKSRGGGEIYLALDSDQFP